jgi:RNA recognition motif-containing protein
VTTTRIFVGNVSYNLDEDGLRQAFTEACGFEPVSVNMPRDKESGRPRGFAFIEIPSVETKRVLEVLNDTYVEGRKLRADKAEWQADDKRRGPKPAPRVERRTRPASPEYTEVWGEKFNRRHRSR